MSDMDRYNTGIKSRAEACKRTNAELKRKAKAYDRLSEWLMLRERITVDAKYSIAAIRAVLEGAK